MPKAAIEVIVYTNDDFLEMCSEQPEHIEPAQGSGGIQTIVCLKQPSPEHVGSSQEMLAFYYFLP